MILSVSEDIVSEMDSVKTGTKIDPFTLMILKEVISAVLVYIVNNCILNKRVANDPNFIQKGRLRLFVNRMSRQKDLERGMRDEAYDAILKKGVTSSQEDINQVVTEVKQFKQEEIQ